MLLARIIATYEAIEEVMAKQLVIIYSLSPFWFTESFVWLYPVAYPQSFFVDLEQGTHSMVQTICFKSISTRLVYSHILENLVVWNITVESPFNGTAHWSE